MKGLQHSSPSLSTTSSSPCHVQRFEMSIKVNDAVGPRHLNVSVGMPYDGLQRLVNSLAECA